MGYFRGISRISSGDRNSDSERLDLYSKCIGDFIKFLEFVISNPNKTDEIDKEKEKLKTTIEHDKGTVEYNTYYPNENTKYKKCLDDSLKFLDDINTNNINVNEYKTLL